MSSIDSSAPAICKLRTTPPINIKDVWSKPFGAGLIADGLTLSKVTVSLLSLASVRPVSMRTAPASTSAIEVPFVPVASTAICFAALAKGTPRARPDSVPSALRVMRSLGLAGATVISPSGEAILACASSHPASMVSTSGTAIANRPAAPTTPKPSARLAPEPPQSSDTHDSGRPASDSAFQSGAFHSPFLSWLMVCASARSAKIFSAVSTTMFSLSDTAFLLLGVAGYPAGLHLFLHLFLRPMMGKSYPPDKADVRYARLRGWHEAYQFRRAEFRISRRGMVSASERGTAQKQQEETDVEGWHVRDHNRLGIGPGRCDRRYSGQERRAHCDQLFQQQERGRSDRGKLPQGRRRRSRGGAGRRRTRRGLPEDRCRRRALGQARCADQQCRHRQARAA